ncbi:hypothetical protein BDQ17DRAFT_1266271, partial [Cyathus striatus]
KHHHILNSMLVSWPDDKDVDTIVQKSSGQFIYVSTVIHYVSDSQHNPQK